MNSRTNLNIDTNTPENHVARMWGLTAYAFQGLGMAFIPMLFVSMALIFWQRDQNKGTIVEPHFRWQIRTFGYTAALVFIGIVIGAVATKEFGYIVIFVGVVLSCARTVWGAFRLFRYRSPFSETPALDPSN